MEEPSMDMVTLIREIYRQDDVITSQIDALQKILKNKLLSNMTSKLYHTKITDASFRPSNVQVMFEIICDVEPSKADMAKLAIYLCELYGIKAKSLLHDVKNLDWLYYSYFDHNETVKLVSMLSELVSKIEFKQVKMYLIQILLAKLSLAEMCMNNGKEPNYILSYCLALKKYLADNLYKKYHDLFSLLIECCTNIILASGMSTLRYVSDHLEEIIHFEPDRLIHLEKFIVKIIRNNSYRALIAIDTQDSADDSDIEVYHNDGDDTFVFTEEDVQDEFEDRVVKKRNSRSMRFSKKISSYRY